VIFCGGPWSGELLQKLGVQLQVTRQVLAWVWPKRPELFELGRLPVWFVEQDDGEEFYGFPMMGDRPGLKLARHHHPDPIAHPKDIRRDTNESDEQRVRPYLRRHMPEGDGPLLSLETCMYTNTPDRHFIIDHHPGHKNVTVACGFSGHGFKFASCIGEILADLATAGATAQPIEFLRLARFGVRV
jgi:sarcosine oxidase